MQTKKHRVLFQPSGRRGEVEPGKTLLEAAQALGVDLESICGGKGSCGKCKVRVEQGAFDRGALESAEAHLSPASDSELRFLTEEDGPGTRLACLARVRGDVHVFVPEKSRAGKQVVRKAAKELEIPLDPPVKTYYVELAPPRLGDPPRGDWERLRARLEEEYALEGLSIDYGVLQGLQEVLRGAEWRVTVSVWLGREVIRVAPGFVEAAYGVAVDVGTTTVAAYLCDLETGRTVATESMMNPQVSYGEDIMSRITYAMNEPGGLETMRRAIVAGVNELLEKLVTGSGVGDGLTARSIVDMTVVFNTAMHHIFLGFYPEFLGKSPFVPAVQEGLDVKAERLGIGIHPAAYVHVLPLEAGFVGADNVGVLIAEEPYGGDDRVLIIDIGTNGEILLGNRERVCSASCATGPAFEGAQIRFGMRAAPGAIERVEIDPDTKEPRYRVIGKADWHSHIEPVGAKGICGSGIIDAVAQMFRAGVIDKQGTLLKDPACPRVRQGADGKWEYVLAWAEETAIGADITVTQKDVQAVLLAKGALYAGAKLLMKRMGIERVDRVVLAGAFGSYIDKRSALILGMFPDCPLESVFATGNAAGDGARMALLNVGKRREAERRARWVEYVEIAMEPGFPKEFMRAMQIPHAEDAFPHVEAALADVSGN
ncbi:MAG: ASKHA domain-containing protein [Deferrisomatales bacterium]